MRDTECAPDHDISVINGVSSLDCVRYTVHFYLALKGVATASIQLSIAVPGNPDMVLGKLGTPSLDGVRIRQECLRSQRGEFVRHRLLADGIGLVRIDHLDHSIQLRGSIQIGGTLNRLICDPVVVTIGVGGFVHGYGM